MWDICSLGTEKSSAVSDLDSVEVKEVIWDSDSPGPEQPERERRRARAGRKTQEKRGRGV
jgi:hypothetical protein